MDHPDFPWTGILFGAPILGIWYWCTDQYIVQRVLSARNIEQARKGTIFGGFLKMLPLFLFVLPGIIAFALAKKELLTLESNDQALIVMVKAMVPAGVRGLVIAGLLAALMSSLSSVFNSCSTLFTIDVYKRWKPETSERNLVIIGQVATVIMVGIGLLWIPFMENVSDQLFVYLQSVQGYISPPIASVFLLGIFFKRLNGQGAMAALLTGLVIGATRFILEMNKSALDGFWFEFADINFLHFAIFLFVICSIILVVVSLVTPAPDAAHTDGITYKRGERTESGNKSKDALLTVILLIIIAAIWIYFS
jgi:SSS family solute:Na+ symporter